MGMYGSNIKYFKLIFREEDLNGNLQKVCGVSEILPIILFLKKILFYLFSERREEREKERRKNINARENHRSVDSHLCLI